MLIYTVHKKEPEKEQNENKKVKESGAKKTTCQTFSEKTLNAHLHHLNNHSYIITRCDLATQMK